MEQPQVNIASQLAAMAEQYPDKRAIVCPPDGARTQQAAMTFRELEQETDRYAFGLERAGIRRGTRTILMVRPGKDFFVLTFALFKIGAVPVFIDPGIGKRQLARCLAGIEPEAFIGIPLAHALRLLFRKAFRSVRICVTVGKRRFWGGWTLAELRTDPWKPYAAAPTGAGDPAAILFTSGSTGPPKGTLYEHGMFDAQVRYLNEQYGYSAEETDLPTFPLFALFDAALGMTAFIPEMDFTRPGFVDPRNIIGPIQREGITHMFGSPALLDRVGRYGEAHGVRLPSLKRVITAGAPVRPEILGRFSKMLEPGAEIFTPYGATEALPVASIGSREILAETKDLTAQGAGTCVGRPLAGVSVRIIRISDDPIQSWEESLALADGEIGEIAVQGPNVTREYYRNPEATALARIPAADGTFWRRMGDVGYFDAKGRLWFCGRKSHRVVTPEGTLFTIPCEAIFNRHPAVLRTALVGVGVQHDRRPVLCAELAADTPRRRRKQIACELLELGAASDITRPIRTVLFHPGFPVDIRHNAKIFREKLAVWAARRLRARTP